jgi:hypothetical protein
MTGVGGGTAAGIAAGIEFGPASGLEAAVVFGLGPGLAIWIRATQAPLVKLAELLLACQGTGRVRFMHLLQEASGRQVLRQAGTVYQFRHAALQDRLAATHAPRPAQAFPSPAASAISQDPETALHPDTIP